MAIQNGNKIVAPIGIADVKQVLGASSNDLGTLCTHQNINKWAQHKPIRSSLFYMDMYAFREQFISDFGVTVNVANYLGDIKFEGSRVFTMEGVQITISMLNIAGLIVPMINNTSNEYSEQQFLKIATIVIRNLVNFPELNWQHQKPRGGSYDEPYRLTDFNGYRHDVNCSFQYVLNEEIYGRSEEIGISFKTEDGALSFENDLAQILGYRPGINALEWELGIIVTTSQGNDHKLIAAVPLNANNDMVRIEDEEITSAGFNKSSFYVYLCAIRNDRKRIYFFPEFEGNMPYKLIGFKSGIDPDLDGGIGHIIWSTPSNTYYAYDGKAGGLTNKWFMPMSGIGTSASNAVFAVSNKVGMFTIFGRIQNDSDKTVSIDVEDGIYATIEYAVSDGSTKIINPQCVMYRYDGVKDGNPIWTSDDGGTTLDIKAKQTCFILFDLINIGPSNIVSTENYFGTIKIKYKTESRTRTLAEYKIALRKETNNTNMDKFYDASSKTYKSGTYSLQDIV